MKFTDVELTVLKNFASINPAMVIHPDKFAVINSGKSVIGSYAFANPYSYEAFGIYEVPEVLAVLGAMKSPDIEVGDKYITVKDGNAKVKYFTTLIDVLPKVPNVDAKFKDVTCELVFDLPAEILASIYKMTGILGQKFLFFETDKKKIRITAANVLEASNNMFEFSISDGIKTNSLPKALKIPLEDLKILPGDYTVSLSSAKISKWTNKLNGVVYYIGCSANTADTKAASKD